MSGQVPTASCARQGQDEVEFWNVTGEGVASSRLHVQAEAESNGWGSSDNEKHYVVARGPCSRPKSERGRRAHEQSGSATVGPLLLCNCNSHFCLHLSISAMLERYVTRCCCRRPLLSTAANSLLRWPRLQGHTLG